VLCAERRVLGKTTSEELRGLLVRLAARATEWRSTYFLDLKPHESMHSGRPGWLTHKPSEVLGLAARRF
jgi:hypothetical protein